jgi:hypothetical protein
VRKLDIFLNPAFTKCEQPHINSRLMLIARVFLDTLDQAEHGREQHVFGKAALEHSLRNFERGSYELSGGHVPHRNS